ncbi:MAG: cation diffusion facilitator family transporter [Gracilibacter sp. BRH_c7a]|nr:MAG: cation diffusion facilitator family transporter [Gracilibacter sp. BRH_c7a]
MLSQFLVKHFIKDYQRTDLSEVRGRYGYLSGIVGIIANTALFGIKLATGLMINSIALIGDALNNLTDAASSLVTIVGFKLASKPADEEHPFGHGRLEYIAGLIVSFLIILVGYELIKSSVDRIIYPVQVSFSWPVFLIILFAIFVKSWLFFLNRLLSKEINSKALLAVSFDSLSDMIATGCIGVSLIASLFTTFPLDGYVGIIVSLLILYSGISLTKETISPLLGEVPEQELIIRISEKILSYEKVVGIHDLIVHTYGPNKYMASIHVELPADQDIIEMHEYIDLIERQVAKELNILITIHMDPLNLDCQEIIKMQEELSQILSEFPPVLSFHDFRIVGKGERENLVFDVVVKHGTTRGEEKKLRSAITEKVQEKHPCYYCVITFDQNDMLVN